MNQFNSFRGDAPTDPPRDWNSQPPAVHFKSCNFTLKNGPVVSAIVGGVNYCVIGNGDVEAHPLEYPFEYTSEYFDIHTPLQSNQYMMIKCTISWNYSTYSMIMIF